MTSGLQNNCGVGFIGSGSATPSQSISNDELGLRVDTNDAWIRSRTGIHSRHVIGSDLPLLLTILTVYTDSFTLSILFVIKTKNPPKRVLVCRGLLDLERVRERTNNPTTHGLDYHIII